MWFQRLVEVDESEPEPMPRPVEMLAEESTAAPSNSKTKRLGVSVVTPAEFQRARLVSTLRKTAESEQSAEAYSRAMKDWKIVDVPPGTERMRIFSMPGGSAEVTWQRYNSVRRIPLLADGSLYRWSTEITKDLVVREAIEDRTLEYEEAEYFYYVIQYLHHEDVQELVNLSDSIRRKRSQRTHEIGEWRERERCREEREDFEQIEGKERPFDNEGARRPRPAA